MTRKGNNVARGQSPFVPQIAGEIARPGADLPPMWRRISGGTLVEIATDNIVDESGNLWVTETPDFILWD